jgi:hypothetical protein
MREIKLRARLQYQHNPKMVDTMFYTQDFFFQRNWREEWKLLSLDECTGKKDKNDLDICENDWCRACFRDAKGFHYVQGRIFMDDYMWCLEATDGEIYSINRLHDWEVLGNKYQNPEWFPSEN